jgi:DNA repair protein RecN (Recombination protein N)
MAQAVEGDPARLQWLDDRLALIHRLKRKYGQTVPEILSFFGKARERLHSLETRGEQVAAVDAELGKNRKRLEAAGGELSEERRAGAKKLVRAITAELRDLGFPHGAFEVGLSAAEPRPSGLDAVEFGFAPNPGEPARPLRAIASGGEISRVMLATKAVLASHDRIPVLVFDEIDANIGGEMGDAIGGKLEAVASSHQVLCITHLPQVAVHGGTHFQVAKRVREGRTVTEIRRVEGEERVDEVARMLGGKDITSVAAKHAREMLQRR